MRVTFLFFRTLQQTWRRAHPLLRLAPVAFIAAGMAPAQTLTTLVNFNGSNGAAPLTGSLMADANGNLLGTTFSGGASNLGTVFQIAKTTTGYSPTPTVLFSFDGTHGAVPYSGLIADSQGNLFGTTALGGTSNLGTLFEIAKTATGYATTPTILFNFDGAHGAAPFVSLIADASGNLFGTTSRGGDLDRGTVFMLEKTSGGYAAAPTVLVIFNGGNGRYPESALIADTNGNLFGTTFEGGALDRGTVFEVVKTAGGYASNPVILFNFDGTNGHSPIAALIADASGNLFGTTSGGGASNFGTVFEIVKTSTGYAATPTILFNFDGFTGAEPVDALIADRNGSLFGTTYLGGASGQGTVFEIVKTSTGYATTPITLFSFDVTHGIHPYAGLIANTSGSLFGMTFEGGASNLGTVFQLAGSGFVPLLGFPGNPGTANCSGASMSTLARTYGGLAAAAKALGYASAADLQAAIAAYCGK